VLALVSGEELSFFSPPQDAKPAMDAVIIKAVQSITSFLNFAIVLPPEYYIFSFFIYAAVETACARYLRRTAWVKTTKR
jgi:hypothetical protein